MYIRIDFKIISPKNLAKNHGIIIYSDISMNKLIS